MESSSPEIQAGGRKYVNAPRDEDKFPKIAREIVQKLARHAADRVIKLQFQQQYQEMLEVLCETMQDPDREREVVREQAGKLRGSGRPAPRHIPTLIKLERITREAGGTAFVDVERMGWEALSQLSHPELVPFLLEAFHYHRRHDNFGGRRRDWAVEITATIAARTDDPQALDALQEMLSASKPPIRGKALIAIYETYDWEKRELPAEVIERCWDMAENDRSGKVRQTAVAVLQRVGEVTYEEAMAYLEE